MYMYKTAYSLIEVIIVMAMVFLLLTTSFNLYSQINRKNVFYHQAGEIEELIREAQQNAQAGKSNNNSPLYWGIQAQQDQIMQFASASRDFGTRLTQYDFVVDLQEPWELTGINLPDTCAQSGDCIFFARLSGTASDSGELIVRDNSLDLQTVINIYTNGFVSRAKP